MTKRFDFTLNWKEIAKPYYVWLLLIYINIGWLVWRTMFVYNQVLQNVQPSNLDMFMIIYNTIYTASTWFLTTMIIKKAFNRVRIENTMVKMEFSLSAIVPYFIFVTLISGVPPIFVQSSNSNMLGIYIILYVLIISIVYSFFFKKVMDYIAINTSVYNEHLSFSGNAGNLIWSFIKLVGLFILICIAIGIVISIFSAFSGENSVILSSIVIPIIMLIFGFYFGMIFQAVVIYWVVQFKFKNYNIGFRKLKASDCTYYGNHAFLGFITIGLYFPKALLKILERFLPEIRISSEDKEFSLQFTGHNSEGYALLLKQYLFQVITLGIYTPFAIQVSLKYILQNITLQERIVEHETEIEQQHTNIPNSEEI